MDQSFESIYLHQRLDNLYDKKKKNNNKTPSERRQQVHTQNGLRCVVTRTEPVVRA